MDNSICKELCKSVSGILKIQELVKDKFYFAISTNNGLEEAFNLKNDKFIFYCAHNDLYYQNFIHDFGPYNLANLWRYCMYTKKFLKIANERNKIFVTISSPDKKKIVNSAFCVGAFAILYLNYEPEHVFNILSDNGKIDFIGYRDASYVKSPYSLQLKDCLLAIEKARKLKFIDLDRFNVAEYTHYEEVNNGDLNWIIKDKMLAFLGPHNVTQHVNNYPQFSPEFYFDYFRKKNVTTIIRLNDKEYDERKFIENGFDHRDLIYKDGTTPSLEILNEFLQICENAKGAIAVHCQAGLGRTGTLIACYLIKHYRFTAGEAIAWCRICRPGSVIANQQSYLVKIQSYLLFKGQVYNIERRPDDISTGGFDKMQEDSKIGNKNELNSKVKRITSKLKLINLEIADKQNGMINKSTQGDILNKLKWTRSKSKTPQVDQDILDSDEKGKELYRLTDTNPKTNISIKRLIQHYNSKSNENEKDNFRKNSEFKLSNPYRTRSLTSLLNRSKVHSSNAKPNLINNTILNDKLIKTINNNLRITNNILQNEKKQNQLTRCRHSSKSELNA